MKEPIRRAVSLRCRTDRAIERLCKARAYFERGALSASELLDEVGKAASRAGDLELANPSSALERSVNRKVMDYRRYARNCAAHAIGCKSTEQARAKALESARLAITLRNREAAWLAHELIWAATGGLPNEEEWEAFEACERI